MRLMIAAGKKTPGGKTYEEFIFSFDAAPLVDNDEPKTTLARNFCTCSFVGAAFNVAWLLDASHEGRHIRARFIFGR